jgi:hypothetical protein
MLDANQISAIESAMEEEHRRDREALQRLKRFLPLNGNGSGGRVSTFVIDRTNEAQESEVLDFMDTADSEPLTIIDTVEQIMQADPHKKWSVPLMVAHLKNIKFPLEAKKPEATMGLVFTKLMKKRKTIVRVRRGSGRMPNLFRAIPREHQEDASDSDTPNERVAS